VDRLPRWLRPVRRHAPERLNSGVVNVRYGSVAVVGWPVATSPPAVALPTLATDAHASPGGRTGRFLTSALIDVLVLFMSNERMEMQARHGEILTEVADMSLQLARRLHERAMAAETEEEVQAAASAFHRISRSLRQTLALEARLERDSRRDAVEARRLAEEDRREQVKARKAHVGNVGSRLIWTEAERDDVGRLLVDLKRWCDEAGLSMGVDEMGTMFATRTGTDPEALPVYMGSHLDTQPTGGKYDGVLGVLGALEVVRTLNDLGIRTKHPIVVTNWTNEEGTRFAPAMLASGVFAGVIDQDFAYDRRDAKGLRFGDELVRIGWKGTEKVGARKMHAMFELHIEQGPILEAEGREIGVVTHGQGLRWIECTLTGKGQHTGSTPMYLRRNAGRALARMIDLVHEIAMQYQPNAVGAIGHIDVHPNSRNIIPEKIVFTVDFRSHLLETLEAMVAEFTETAPGLAAEVGVKFASQLSGFFDPPAFDPVLVGRVRAAAEKLGYSHMDLISGAGHDACWINRVAPTAMIMCPCKDGLSHNEAEEITPDWARAGVDVLLHAVLETAEVVS
jgi:N-carbamoyl-L-amino-acid hydrolase